MPANSRTITVAVVGGGMFFDDIIGQSFKDLIRGGIAGCLTSIGMSHLAADVADVSIDLCAVGTRSEQSGTAGRIVEWFAEEFAGSSIEACYGETVWNEIIERHQPDVMFVVTPDHLHTDPILAALDAG